ncbi:MAG: transglutaminase-like domain-containing protein, partial [Thermoanaerobaculia bacterium]
MKELWSPRDASSLDSFRAAVRRQDLLGALAAVEGSAAALAAQDRAQLESWGAEVRCALEFRPAATPHEQARALAGVLGDGAGFQGDELDYYSSSNCLIHEVIERRRGMPILLSIVWLEVGRQAKLTLCGVGMPGHFLVRVGGAKGVLVDPFSGGSIVSLEDCRRTVRELSGGAFAWTDDFLSPSTTDQILERVLQNLAGSYS